MTFLSTVLEPPGYGWRDEQGGAGIAYTIAQILREFFFEIERIQKQKEPAVLHQLDAYCKVLHFLHVLSPSLL